MNLKLSAGYVIGVVLVALIVTNAGFNLNQIMSITLFIAIVLGAIIFWRLRVAFAFVGVALMLFSGILDVPHLLKYAHFDVILFLVGMMTVVGFLEERGFFEYILNIFVKYFSKNGFVLLSGLLALSAMLSALVDEVTSILFITALTLRIAKRYNLDVLPMVIATVMATNVGSSFTVVGNPVGVLLAFEGNLTFLDFIRWAFPTGLAVLILTIVIGLIYWKPYINSLSKGMKTIGLNNPTSQAEKMNMGRMKIPWVVFIFTIGGLIIHSPLEEALHLPKNTLLLAVPLIMGGAALLLSREKARDIIEKKIEWWTLAFFIFFFTSVGTLAFTGVTKVIAQNTVSSVGENPVIITVFITWLSGILSAFMDNILAVATLTSIVHELGALGYNLFPLWWGLLFGACYLGNLTMIGSTANIVALGIIEKERKRYINFLDWVKPGLAIAVPQLMVATLLLYLQHFLVTG